ncbi:MAG: hypothetical protein JWM37_647 [Candidatus Saccharibacteria bacterium]|nr:hypothetical protein [Candidatus Saccharibacteria bacterium]
MRISVGITPDSVTIATSDKDIYATVNGPFVPNSCGNTMLDSLGLLLGSRLSERIYILQTDPATQKHEGARVVPFEVPDNVYAGLCQLMTPFMRQQFLQRMGPQPRKEELVSTS